VLTWGEANSAGKELKGTGDICADTSPPVQYSPPTNIAHCTEKWPNIVDGNVYFARLHFINCFCMVIYFN